MLWDKRERPKVRRWRQIPGWLQLTPCPIGAVCPPELLHEIGNARSQRLRVSAGTIGSAWHSIRQSPRRLPYISFGSGWHGCEFLLPDRSAWGLTSASIATALCGPEPDDQPSGCSKVKLKSGPASGSSSTSIDSAPNRRADELSSPISAGRGICRAHRILTRWRPRREKALAHCPPNSQPGRATSGGPPHVRFWLHAFVCNSGGILGDFLLTLLGRCPPTFRLHTKGHSAVEARARGKHLDHAVRNAAVSPISTRGALLLTNLSGFGNSWPEKWIARGPQSIRPGSGASGRGHTALDPAADWAIFYMHDCATRLTRGQDKPDYHAMGCRGRWYQTPAVSTPRDCCKSVPGARVR
jgi:hypothetical protein